MFTAPPFGRSSGDWCAHQCSHEAVGELHARTPCSGAHKSEAAAARAGQRYILKPQ